MKKNKKTIEDVKVAILKFAGPIVTVRAFKQGGPRALRSTSPQEFASAASHMSSFGQMVSLRIPRQPKATHNFIKAQPCTINWDVPLLPCKREVYESKFSLPLHSSIGPAIKATLINNGHVAEDFFNY